MELKITFSNPNPNTRIPIDYQYFLSSWMYKVIGEGDMEYATFLHDTGYSAFVVSGTTVDKPVPKSRVFKLFNFSNLILPKFRIEKESKTIHVQSETIELVARFKVDAALGNFIKGLFQGQSLTLKNGYNSMATFDIVSIESNMLAVLDDTVQVKALSPIVLSKKRTDGSDEYLEPSHPDYEAIFFNNLIGKYIASGGQLLPEWQEAKQTFVLNENRKIHSKLIEIPNKDKAKGPIKVKGYLYEFELKAPKELAEIGLLAGFGKENAMGFGFGKVKENKAS